MDKKNTVTCSFILDKDIYNNYKSIVVKNNSNVKGDLVRHMLDVIKYQTTNKDTIEALKEVEALKANPNKKNYNSFSEILAEPEDE